MKKAKIKELLKKWQKQSDKYLTVSTGKQLTWASSSRFESMSIIYQKCIKDLKELL